MHTQEMKEIEKRIQSLKDLIVEWEGRWEQHAHSCSFYLDNDDGIDCLHDDPAFDPVCEPGNCPLIK